MEVCTKTQRKKRRLHGRKEITAHLIVLRILPDRAINLAFASGRGMRACSIEDNIYTTTLHPPTTTTCIGEGSTQSGRVVLKYWLLERECVSVDSVSTHPQNELFAFSFFPELSKFNSQGTCTPSHPTSKIESRPIKVHTRLEKGCCINLAKKEIQRCVFVCMCVCGVDRVSL